MSGGGSSRRRCCWVPDKAAAGCPAGSLLQVGGARVGGSGIAAACLTPQNGCRARRAGAVVGGPGLAAAEHRHARALHCGTELVRRRCARAAAAAASGGCEQLADEGKEAREQGGRGRSSIGNGLLLRRLPGSRGTEGQPHKYPSLSPASCMDATSATAAGRAGPSTTTESSARAALQLLSFCGGCQQIPSCRGRRHRGLMSGA